VISDLSLPVADFFREQPIKAPAVFFMRLVLHDWPDNKCRQILEILREAAAPSTKLLIYESIMLYTCDYNGPFSEVTNAKKPPAPLLSNLGMGAGGFLTMVDIQVCFGGSMQNFDSEQCLDDEFL
jgi:hypothetical protein